jgi:hypothetical protein
MKVKKALKRLNRVEAQLSAVLNGYAKGNRQIVDLLTAAKTSVGTAREAIDHPAPATTAGKSLANAGSGSRKHRTGRVRKTAARPARKPHSTAARTTARAGSARKAVTKALKRTVPRRAKPNLKPVVSTAKANRIKITVPPSSVLTASAAKPAIRGVSAALPATSRQAVPGLIRKPAANTGIGTLGKQPDRSVDPASKPTVHAGSVGIDPFRQG